MLPGCVFVTQFVADYHGEDHFMTRIGVGGIINVEKMDEAHRVLDEIKAFHHHHKCRKHATAQVAINSQEARYALSPPRNGYVLPSPAAEACTPLSGEP